MADAKTISPGEQITYDLQTNGINVERVNTDIVHGVDRREVDH